MRFVNMSTRPAFNTMCGTLGPGEISADGGPYRSQLEKALANVVNACGNRLGIRLNEREADLLGKVVTLDEKGCAFKSSSIPEEIRKDPLGLKKAEKMEDEAQKRHLDEISKRNKEAADREAEINGETMEERKPAGPAAMEGAEVGPGDLKSGFEKIMEENARIAAQKPKMNVSEALDPVGFHAKGAVKDNEVPVDASEDLPPPAADIKSASNVDGDVARLADTTEPVPQAQNAKNAMDRQAAEMARGISALSALDNPPKAKGKGKPASKPGKKAK